MMKLVLVRNMGAGEISSPKRRRDDVVGDTITDSFLDSYKEEGLVLGDIIDLCNRTKDDFVNVRFYKKFLKRIVHSHLVHIRELEKDVTGRKYAH